MIPEELKVFADQKWRLNNLYKIINAQGREVQFVMNDAQEHLYDNKHTINAILKARQLGFSTFVDIYFLDCCLFIPNTSAGIIAQGLTEAEDLFRNKVRYAYDRIPDFLKEKLQALQNSARRLEFSNGSSITVGTSLRGGTMQKLHVSEYGKIAARYPEKAREIKTGALNTVHVGQEIFIESTAEGQQGEFYEIIQTAKKLKQLNAKLTPIDPKLHFFPWYDNKGYQLPNDVDNVIITREDADYFARIGVELSPAQKAWYVKKKEQQGEYMKREYPSTPDEAFEQSMEGAIYIKEMTHLRQNKRIGYFPHEPSQRVYTFWDLGKGSDYTAIWFFQHIGNEYRFIDYHESSNNGWSFYAQLLNSKPYVYAEHLLPHDGETTTAGKVMSNPKNDLLELGIRPIKIITRTKSVWDDIKGDCRAFLMRASFDETNCAVGIKHLDNYRKEWDDSRGCWKDKPRHDESSHCADAFRTGAMGFVGRIQELSNYDYAPSFAIAQDDYLD